MEIGDTVLLVMGTSPKINKVLLVRGHPGDFTAEKREGCLISHYFNWGQIFDNSIEADRAIIRNIDRAIADHQRQIDDLLKDRANVQARLLPR